MQFTFSIDKLEKALQKVSSGLSKLKELPREIKQKLLPDVVKDVQKMRKLSADLEKAPMVLTDSDFKSRTKDFSELEQLSASVVTRINSLESTPVELPDVEKKTSKRSSGKTKSSITVGTKTQSLSSLPKVGDLLSKLKSEATATEKSAKDSRNKLAQWWKSLREGDSLILPVDPAVTDILELTSKKLAIPRPPKQPFPASVKFKNVPKIATIDFRKDASSFLQANASEALTSIKRDIAKSLQKLSNDFEKADQRDDSKAAQVVYDNVNALLQNQMPSKIEAAMKKAAEQTFSDLLSQKRKGYVTLMKTIGTAIDKVNVDTSVFYAVEFVDQDSSPGTALVKDFLKDEKKFQKERSKYDSAAEAIERGWESLAKTLQSLGKDIDRLQDSLVGSESDFERAVKSDSGSRERSIDAIGEAVTDLKKSGEKLRTSATSIGGMIADAKTKFQKKSRELKDNAKVSQKQVEELRSALGAAEKVLATNGKSQRAAASIPGLLKKFEEFRADSVRVLYGKNIVRNFTTETLPPELTKAKKTVGTLQNTAQTEAAAAKNVYAIEDELDEVNEAAGEFKA